MCLDDNPRGVEVAGAAHVPGGVASPRSEASAREGRGRGRVGVSTISFMRGREEGGIGVGSLSPLTTRERGIGVCHLNTQQG